MKGSRSYATKRRWGDGAAVDKQCDRAETGTGVPYWRIVDGGVSILRLGPVLIVSGRNIGPRLQVKADRIYRSRRRQIRVQDTLDW